ncbi:MAG TPA: fumarylacetoacetate hydrolase family protein [Caulobacteraceae bacterium]
MILASLRTEGRDGALIVVSPARTHAVMAGVAETLQQALDRWDEVSPKLATIAADLSAGARADAFAITPDDLAAPLPRAYAFLDGSAYYHHMSVIRQVRGAKVPEDFFDLPLLYQGLSDKIIGPTEPIRLREDEAFGIDIEAEVVVITGDVPQGVTAAEAARYIRLIGILNDVSLRGLIPHEIGRGFGFIQGKSASSMGPFVVTPDELGDLWDGKLLSGRYLCHIRGELLGDLDPGQDAAFTYPDLIAHAAKTRQLGAGTVIGAGALANAERHHGSGCIAEARAREHLALGAPAMAYLRYGDRCRLEFFDRQGVSVFGAIDQAVAPWR